MFDEKIVENKGYYDINPVVCGHENCERGHYFGPATRDYILLHFVVSGKGIFSTSRGRYDVGENKIFVIRPNEITYYKADEAEPWEYIWIGFTASEEIKNIFCSQDVISAEGISEYFFEMHNAPDSQNGGVGYEAFLCSKLWRILSRLTEREREEQTDSYSYAKRAVDIMESEYTTGITVSEIASRLHLNRSYFSVIFREYAGCPPAKYLNGIRMKRALSLLCDFGCSVSVTALSVGFSDIFAFSRAFKNYYGRSPSTVKKD